MMSLCATAPFWVFRSLVSASHSRPMMHLRFMEGKKHDTEHFGLRSGLSGPELELTRTLVDEHLHSLDGRDAARAGFLEQRRIQGVVDQVEDQARIPFLGLEGEWMRVAMHAAGRGVDEDVEFGGGDLGAGDG